MWMVLGDVDKKQIFLKDFEEKLVNLELSGL